ncbi:MAG: glucose-6-phosphate dehydrogenase [Candidatus Peribacteraceae bacterium]|jgi:glucose-6-phosphate 1-dehydrogenase
MLAVTHPFSLILFGASGNLAKLKLYPSLFTLALRKRLPKEYAIVGYARTAMESASFRTMVGESIVRDMPEVKEEAVREFLTHCHYVAGQYDGEEDMRKLRGTLTELEEGWQAPVRLAYLSVPPQVIPAIARNLCAAEIPTPGKFRCIVEKPVGHDRESFEEIEKLLTRCFPADDVYFLDHYLGKEAVRNIYYLRYANPLLERLFKNMLIKFVEVTASETLGIEGRAGYFEHTGAFRDMFQSHLLEMCSLLTMSLHESDAEIPSVRLQALRELYLPPAKKLEDIALQGQYAAGSIGEERAKGYREEEGADPQSRTNTYAAVKLLSRDPRWQGVPFYVRSGKRLRKKETRISLVFRGHQESGEGGRPRGDRAAPRGEAPNRLDIIAQGEAGMRIHLQTKVGGSDVSFRPLVLTDPLVCTGDCLPEYGLLLLEAINGIKTWFLSPEEIRAAWQLTDPLQSHFDHPDTPLYFYPAGSHGPVEADAWIGKDGVGWL